MALTFDDLPFVELAQKPELASAQAATRKLLEILREHQAPAIGFVNEAKLNITGEVKQRTDLLKQWVDAGMILGNHTYSHPDFNSLTVEQFEDEIIRGEAVTRGLMKSHGPYQLYFRHPMTHTGDTQAKKEAVAAFLAQRGYRIAPHTIENSDFIFNAAYVDALRKGDETLAARFRKSYLEFTIAATEFAERVSPKIFGREIPQTMLLHANDINVDCLNEMLKRFEERGYRFITLDAAMGDPAYQTKDSLVSKSGPTWLWRWTKSKGMNISFNEDPEPPQWVLDLFSKRSH